MFRLLAATFIFASVWLPVAVVSAREGEPVVQTRPAGVAMVAVEDPDGVLAAGRAVALKARLASLPGGGVAVVFSQRKAAGGIETQAEEAFRRLAMPDGAFVVAVAVGDREVGAHVGPALRARGVDRSVITAAIGRHFKAYARQGRYDDGAFALAEALASHQEAPPSQGESRGAPDAPAEESLGLTGIVVALLLFVGGPIGLVVLVLYLIGRKVRGAGRVVDPVKTGRARFAAIEAARDRVAAGIVELDSAIQLATGTEDPLQGPATAVMAEAQIFMARVEATAEVLVNQGVAEALPEIDALEMTALNLEVSIAALRTCYQGADSALVQQALKLGRKWKRVDAQVSHLVEAHLGSGRKHAVLLDLVAKSREALTTVPHDLVLAQQLIKEAETTLKQMGLTKASTGKAGGASTASDGVSGVYGSVHGWDTRPIHVEFVEHVPSSGGWWGSSTGASASWSSSDGSSSSGSSGSSSWSSSSDSGSSSWGSDSSSSDSGSSSWDSSSSSSDSSGSDKW